MSTFGDPASLAIQLGIDPATLGLTPIPGVAGGAPGMGAVSAPSTATPTGTVGQRDAIAKLRADLAQWGFSPEAIARLVDWGWNEMVVNGASENRVALDMYQQPDFKARFPAIEERARNNLPAITPQQYVINEDAYRQLMFNAKLPPGFYDTNEDFHRFIAENKSPEQIGKRIQEGYQAVAQSPPEIRQWFESVYGYQGDSALAALYLDPDRAQADLEKMTAAAQAGGRAAMSGLGLGQATAENIALMGLSANQLDTSMAAAGRLRGLATENVGETVDLGDEDLILSTLNAAPGSTDLVEQRKARRIAAFAGGGGSTMTRQGFAGLGGAATNR